MRNWSLNMRFGIFVTLIALIVIHVPAFVVARSVDRSVRNFDVDPSVNATGSLPKLSAIQAGMPSAPPAPAGSIEVDENPVYINYTPEELVQNIFITGCLKASNIQFTGNRQQVGYFNRGNSNFPIKEGLILSTGNVADAAGSNNDTRKTTVYGGIQTEPDLAKLGGMNSIYDKSILEFDFIPAGDKVEFRYIFASEEYMEYACDAYNDIFGFFLSGPGINGIYSNNSVNIANLPNGDPVIINKVHGASASCVAVNSQYYLDNPPNNSASPYYLTTQFDGMTVVLTATYPVVACQTYHIKFAISDVWDGKFDSGVFLQARSFVSEQFNGANKNTSVPIPDFANIFEGCSPNYFIINRLGDDISEPLDVPLIFGGTANNGVDISLSSPDLPLRPLPSIITIPANQRSDSIKYYAVDDGLGNNGKSFTIKMLQSCRCDPNPVYIEKTIYIYEKQPFNISLTLQNVKCTGESNGSIVPAISGGSGLYQYTIDNVNWKPELTDIPEGTYTVKVRDYGSCKNTEQTAPAVTIGTDSPFPNTSFSVDDPAVCKGESAIINLSGSESGVNYQLRNDQDNSNVGNPLISIGGGLTFSVSTTTTTTYNIYATAGAGCSKVMSDKSTVTVQPLPNTGPITPD